MNIILFEDRAVNRLKPLTLTHAAFEVRFGAFTMLERVKTILKKEDRLVLIVREELAQITKERFPEATVNPDPIPPGLWLNGRCVWSENAVSGINTGILYRTENGTNAAWFTTEETSSTSLPPEKTDREKTIAVTEIRYLWDSIFHTGEMIDSEYVSLLASKNIYPFLSSGDSHAASIHPSAILVKDENIFMGEDVIISAGVVLDATKGRIILDKDAFVDIGALIQGPVFIGAGTRINPGAKLRGSVTLGPVCKVGGEVEDCIIQGYSNKQHDGFLGHSYVGEWVNLGANTNNSDLKNNYGEIRFNLDGEVMETGLIFLGLLMGDYSKSGISTMFNTGTYVGVGANIFGGDFQEKYIPSFAWGKKGVTDFEKFIQTCEKMKSRRGLKLSDAEVNLLEHLYAGKK